MKVRRPTVAGTGVSPRPADRSEAPAGPEPWLERSERPGGRDPLRLDGAQLAPVDASAVRRTPGYSEPEAVRKAQLDAMFGGSTPIARRTRAAVSTLLTGPAYASLPAAQQATQLTFALRGTDVVPDIAGGDVMNLPTPLTQGSRRELHSYGADGRLLATTLQVAIPPAR